MKPVQITRVKLAARIALGLIWLYEGLVPKLLFLHADQVELVRRSGLWWHSPQGTLLVLGAAQAIAVAGCSAGSRNEQRRPSRALDVRPDYPGREKQSGPSRRSLRGARERSLAHRLRLRRLDFGGQKTGIRRKMKASIRRRLQRHPLPVIAFFRHSLVVTYALPREVLQPLLPPGLVLDSLGDYAFLAVAIVQTEALRPAGLPRALGQDFFLCGYRIFVRFRTASGRILRGLRILRSDTDRRLMLVFGNLLTHYQYRLAQVSVQASDRGWKSRPPPGTGPPICT